MTQEVDMDNGKVLISSKLSNGSINITLDDSFMNKDVIEATILELSDIIFLQSLTEESGSIKLVINAKNPNINKDMDTIRVSFVEKLLENKLRFSCREQLAEIRNSIFKAAFNPINKE